MKYQRSFYLLVSSLLTFLFSSSIFAADSRLVNEPKEPATCITLKGDDRIATQTIQQALDNCKKGQAVRLSPGSSHVFLSGPITLPSNVSLIISKDITLQAINDAHLFDKSTSSCGIVNKDGKGCNAFITATRTVNSGIYGPGTIDGQGGVQIKGQDKSWWDLASDAKKEKLKQNTPRLIQINKSKDFTLYNVNLINSPNFHVVFSDGDGFTAWKVKINTPSTARNTDGIDPMSSKNITIAYSNISTGDDNIAIKAYKNRNETSNVSILHNVFGTGHGMSIGSETMGVHQVTVDDLVMNGTTNGLRIKSDKSASGVVKGISYNNVAMTNVKKPIVIDTVYEKKTGNTVPEWSDITFNNITSNTKGTIVLEGENAKKPIDITLHNVKVTPDTIWKVNNVNVNK